MSEKQEVKIDNYIDSFNIGLGKCVSWLTLIMVIVMFVNVVERYLFSSNHIWQQELVLYMHSLVFLAASAYTLKENEHVRVDIFYEHFSAKKKAIIDVLGTIIFLFPVCIAVAYFSYGFVVSSWEILEKSREYDGLAGVYLLKTVIWVFSATLFLQGVSIILKSVKILKNQ